jgi:XTP/dITP diphosphohydrolase
MPKILIATSNPGKLRDFAGAALRYSVEVGSIPDFSSLPLVIEDGLTFEANARKKAEEYSQYAPGELVVADDSGLEIDALKGAPGVHSARYASLNPEQAEANTDDDANNERVLRLLAAARDGRTLETFRGTAEGVVLETLRGANGFGYDPLFYFPRIGKTFAELTAEQKSEYSHRGGAFRQLLDWLIRQS